MGRLVTGAVLFMCIAVCLVGCKTHTQVDKTNDVRQEYRSDHISSRVIGVTYNDSVHESIKRILSGQVTFWSKPDSIGRQHKVADMDFNSQTDGDRKAGGELDANDSSSARDQDQGGLTDLSKESGSKTSDSRVINNDLLSWIIGIGICLSIGYFVIRKNKKK